MFLGWSIATVVVAYWVENGVVGVINMPKIMLAGRGTTHARGAAGSTAMALFFLVHYGLFWFVHGVFVFVLTTFARSGTLSTGIDAGSVALMALLLFASHGASFFVNYVGRGEYRRTTPGAQMAQPYLRLFILHVAIVVGFFFVIFLNQPVALVALLVLLKTIADLALHLREHDKPNGGDVAPSV